MTTGRNQNRLRGMRPYRGTAGDCSDEGARTRCRPLTRPPKADQDAIPIWLAALMASRCQASVDGEDHAVSWDCIAGRALYTNHGTAAERIEPLGVHLQGGHTVAVYWQAGETNYTVEVYSQSNHFCA